MKKIVKASIAAVALAALIGGNLATVPFAPQITAFLCGTGDNFSNAELTLEQSDMLCRKVGDDSIVLLKNDNDTLPMGTLDKVNVFGWGGTDEGFLLKGVGSGSSTISAKKSVTLLQALKDAGIEYNQELVDVYTSYGKSASVRKNSSLGGSATYRLGEPAASTLEPKIANAKAFSDTAIFVISRCGGENIGDLPATYLDITTAEQATLDLVTENFENVIVLLNTTNTMHAGFLNNDKIDAALYVGITGQSAAAAIPKILTGEVNPSGKLADSMPYANTYDPTYVNIATGSNQYVEDIYYGYKWYETADAEGYFDEVSNEYGKGYDGVVQYPFGYGLSYTEFDWTVDALYTLDDKGNKHVLDHKTAIAADGIDPSEKIYLDVIVTNTADVAGKDVVELYVTPEYTKGEVEKAEINLLDFAKTPELAYQKSSKVTMSFTLYDMASYDAYDKNKNGSSVWELDAGDYVLKLRTDSHNAKVCENSEITFQLTKDVVINQDPVTGAAVENRFTGEGAYLGLQIDAQEYGGSAYMTRADFAGTFPTKKATKPSNAILNKADTTLYDEPYKNLPEVTTGKDNGLYLATLADGSKASQDQLEGKGGEALVWNYELMADLIDYNSTTWEDVLDQLTANEMKNLIQLGGFRRLAVASVGKPLQKDYDGPAGFNTNTLTGSWGGTAVDTETWTAYPSEALIGCSWNKDLMFELGRSMGAEADKTAIDGWYAPGINLHRNAYLGRNFEYYSEDGVLSGKLAANVIYGAKTNGLICYVKHFVCSDSGDNPRDTDTWLTEQNLRENVLKPFEIAVKEGGANAMMSAFNDIGSVWCGANYALQVEILRGEWGFNGIVITDWTDGASIGGMNVRQGVRGGNDLWLNPNNSLGGENLNMNNAIDVKAARIACKNILYSVVDAEYTAEEYRDVAVDDLYQTSGQIGFKEEVFPWWIMLLVVLDVAAVGGLGFWMFVTFKPQKVEEVLAEASDTEIIKEEDQE